MIKKKRDIDPTAFLNIDNLTLICFKDFYSDTFSKKVIVFKIGKDLTLQV